MWWLIAFAVGIVFTVTQLVSLCWNQVHNDTIHGEGCAVQFAQFALTVLFIVLTAVSLKHWLFLQ